MVKPGSVIKIVLKIAASIGKCSQIQAELIMYASITCLLYGGLLVCNAILGSVVKELAVGAYEVGMVGVMAGAAFSGAYLGCQKLTGARIVAVCGVGLGAILLAEHLGVQPGLLFALAALPCVVGYLKSRLGREQCEFAGERIADATVHFGQVVLLLLEIALVEGVLWFT